MHVLGRNHGGVIARHSRGIWDSENEQHFLDIFTIFAGVICDSYSLEKF